MGSSSSTRFIDAALQVTGEKALSCTHPSLKWLIRDHLLSLLHDFPTLSPGSGAYTHDDGTTVHLLHAHGLLPISSSTPPVLLAIWLHQSYPFAAPIVYVFPASSSLVVVPDHPFVEPAGAAAPPYLKAWQYPKSNLSDLVRNLLKLFRFCHPCYIEAAPPPPPCTDTSLATKREAIDRLVARLHYDGKQFRAQFEEDIAGLCSRQTALRERAQMIDAGLRELEQERRSSKKALKDKASDADVLSSWLKSNEVKSSSSSSSVDELEGFEAADEKGRRLLESEAAARAIDDALDVLEEALAAEVIKFGTYIKQVRSCAREQFFHIVKIKAVMQWINACRSE